MAEDLCPICMKPLAEFPAILRQGGEYMHATCWTGEEPAEKPTADNETAKRKKGGDRAA
jgi:hypothetical protein